MFFRKAAPPPLPAAEGTRHLVVGLGNPGRRYRDHRHNLGFRVVDELARRLGLEVDREQCHARLAATSSLLLAQPQTYMNRSGHAVRCLVELHRLELDKVLVVYDDVNLPLGRMRLRPEGGPGGHHGMESIIENLCSPRIPRLRLGVGPSGEGQELPAELADVVLAPFTAEERAAVATMTTAAADACEIWMGEGIGAAMNRFNAERSA